MSKITTFLMFNDRAEQAVELYTSLFDDSEILSLSRYPDGSPLPAGTAMGIEFRLAGQKYMAFNGGPHFQFSDGISLYVNCETQEEVDHFWERLSEGGEPGPCGWLKDRFGLSWQIVPSALPRLLGDEDPRKAGAVMQAMLQMSKLDIAGLQRAYDEAGEQVYQQA